MFVPGDGERGSPAASDTAADACAATRDEEKRVALQRMRTTATFMLAIMLALLFASAAFEAAHPWLHWCRAFAEAAAVGAIADWYAVVALFRRPLGLRIPHTAIIARNQERIAESLGRFVAEHFLTPRNIVGKLRGHNAAKSLGVWLADPGNNRQAAAAIAESVPALIDGIEDAQFARSVERVVLPHLRRLDASRLAAGVLGAVTERRRHQWLLDRALAGMERWVTANEGLLKAKFSEVSKYTPGRLDAYIVDRFVGGIVALLREAAANPHHELRLQFDRAVQDLAARLRTSDDCRRAGRTLMRDCVRHVRNEGHCRALWERTRARVLADASREHSILADVIAGALVSLGKGLADDAAIQRRLNAWWLGLARAMACRYRHHIPALITDVVKGWNAEDAGRRIEAEIGRDLQYIRINGTWVGGIVGVVLHAAALLVAQ